MKTRVDKYECLTEGYAPKRVSKNTKNHPKKEV